MKLVRLITFNVKEIFYTIQGEGPLTGTPAIFIRFSGCNLKCPFCDTDFHNGKKMPMNKIIDEINNLSKNKTNLIVLTGGEPFLQQIQHICKKLISLNYSVQIETNGTLWKTIPKKIQIVCSPKLNKGKYYIHNKILKHEPYLKFLISQHIVGYQDIPEEYENYRKDKIYIQPMDEQNDNKNKANADLVVKLALEKGFKISLQTHKILNIK